MLERPDRALAAWGDALRAARRRRGRLHLRIGLGGLGIAALGLTIAFPPVPRLVWNVSASAPKGLYVVSPGTRWRTGDMVVARTPEPWRGLAAGRGYLPANVPLVKRVAASQGNLVCARGEVVSIDGRRVATRRAHDGLGRRLPWWEGCVRIGAGQAFLLMVHENASFDGRYFGVTASGDIVGKARLSWAF